MLLDCRLEMVSVLIDIVLQMAVKLIDFPSDHGFRMYDILCYYPCLYLTVFN